jgi:U3 small nucleolar RNA-associated protein 14
VPVPLATDSNPWLATRESISKAPRKKNEVVVGKDSASLDKSKNKIRKQAKKQDEEKDKARDDAALEISTDDVMILDRSFDLITASSKSMQAESKVKSSNAAANAVADDSDANSEVEEQEKALQRKTKFKGVKAFEQRDLVARAFAGDNVVQV